MLRRTSPLTVVALIALLVGATPVLAQSWARVDRASVDRLRPNGLPVRMFTAAQSGRTLYIPAAAHLSGAVGTDWRTDLELHNPGTEIVSVTIALLERDRDNSQPATTTVTVPPGESRRFDDVLDKLFGFAGAGALRLVTSTGEVLASSRTYNDQPEGTYGQLVPTFAPHHAFDMGEEARLVQLSQSATDTTGYRTNLGLLNLGSVTLWAEIDLYDADGVHLGSIDEHLSPLELTQLDKVFRAVTQEAVEDGYAVIWGDEPFLAYASVVDNATGDPVFLLAMRPPASGPLIIPAAAHLPGAAGTVWRTDVEVHNPGPTQCSFTVELLERNTDNFSPAAVSYQLDPGLSVRYGDALDTMFGFTGAAALRITPDACSIEVTSRTYNVTAGGTYGQMVPARAAVTAVPSGVQARLVELEESATTSSGFRTNIGLVNATAEPVQVTVELYDGSGSSLGTVPANKTSLGPLEYRQLDRVFRRVSSDAVDNGYAVVCTETAGGAFFAYASVIDNRTGDPIFVPELRASESFTISRQFQETSYFLLDVEMLTPTTGWAVGEPHWDQSIKGYVTTLLHTTDGGATWVEHATGETASLVAVTFVGQTDGWAVGGEGLILHTADGGATWTRQSIATTDELRAVSFTDAMHGWVTAVRPVHWNIMGDEDNWTAAVWHTSDGGDTWTEQVVPENASILHGVQFIDGQTGWAVGARYMGDDPWPEHRMAVYHTTDGGQTWAEQPTPDLKATVTDVEMVDAARGWAVGFLTSSGEDGGATFRTTDGGATWEQLEPGVFFDLLWDVEAVDANRAYIVGANYVAAWGPPVFRTMDGGDTWEKVIQDAHDNDGLQGLALIGGRAIAVGDHDYLATSLDPWGEYDSPHGGNLFEQSYISTHYKLEDVVFVDGSTGWVVGRKSFGPGVWGQVILHTDDGGLTWSEQYEHVPPDNGSSGPFRLDAVTFVDVQTGWAVGRSALFWDNRWRSLGAIVHTEDGGQTWTEQGEELTDGNHAEFFDVQFLDAHHGWALEKGHYDDSLGTSGVFLARTTDGGSTWSWVPTGVEGGLAVGYEIVQGGLHFTDSMNGWIVGGLGEILHTADGGAGWVVQQHDGVSPHMLQVTFTDADSGWIAAEGGVFATIDGGVRWNGRDLEVAGDLHDIQFPTPATGWAVGDRGVILRTTDGGSSWGALDSGTPVSLLGLHCVRADLCWAAGAYGEILRIGN